MTKEPATTGIPAPSFIYAPPDVPLKVLHQDASILVLSKPSGLLSVPGKDPKHKDCLEFRAQDEFPEALTVHRLDKDTSGVCVMGMGKEAHRHLSMQFAKRYTKKRYLAEAWGNIEEDQGEIDLPLRCDWPNRPRQMVDCELGKASQTYWEVISRTSKTSRVSLTPITGRSHQLRVHLASIGHPILGDRFYAPTEAIQAAGRLMLHAEMLELFHPVGGKTLRFEEAAPF